MEPWLIRIANYLLTQSWQIAVLTIVVALATYGLRNRSAHVRYLLWLIVLAKALVPPLYSIPVAVLPQQERAASVPVPPMAEGMVAEHRAPEAAGTQAPRPAAGQSEAAAPPQVTKRPATYDIRAWLAVGWFVGVSVLSFYYLANALRTQIWLQRRRKTLPSEFARGIESFFTAHGVRRKPRVWLLERINQPFVWGLVRGSIYLPAKLWHGHPGHDFFHGLEARATFQASLLGHELCHVIRLDAMINSLQVIAQTIFWFHPCLWWANAKIRAEREKCCDEMTIARLNARPEEYGEAIVETLAAKYEQARPVPSLAVAGQIKNIEERIKTMLKPGRKFYKHPTLPAATVALLFAVCTVPTTLVLTARAGTKPEAKSLHEATEAGDVEQVKLLILKGADVNAKKANGWTPLHFAAYYGQKEVATVLLGAGANVNAANASDSTPLHLAVEFGAKYVPELLVAKGANISARDKAGNTPLHYAAGRLEVHQDLLELLIIKGDDINARNNRGQTPLHLLPRGTKQNANLELTVSALLAHGAEVDAKDNSGCTPLHFAGQRKVAELLLARGADIKAKAADGTTALHRAAMNGRYDVVEFLLDKGADINSAQSDGRTALHLATEAGHATVAELLIARGAAVNAESKEGETPLDLAGLGGKVKLCALLTAKGAKINSLCSAAATGDLAKVESFIKESTTTNEKDSALCTAAACGQDNVAELLISKGVPASARDKSGQTALHLAAGGGHSDVAKRLLANRADVKATARNGETPLHSAASSGQKELIALLIANGADVNAQDVSKRTPFDCAVLDGQKEIADLLLEKGAVVKTVHVWSLHSACANGQRDLAELLIKKGAEVNEEHSWSPAHEAVWNQHTHVLALLLDHGADANAEDRFGWSLLHYAAGWPDMTKLLLDKGANPNVVERERGRTPLLFAAGGRIEGKDYKTAAELLIKYGANVNAKDWDGKTPLSRAQEAGHTEIVELLKKHGAKE